MATAPISNPPKTDFAKFDSIFGHSTPVVDAKGTPFHVNALGDVLVANGSSYRPTGFKESAPQGFMDALHAGKLHSLKD